MKTMSAFNKIKSNKALVPYLLMILGMGLFLLSNGKWIIPIFTWIAPVFLIRAFRDFKRWYSFIAFFVLIAFVHSIRLKGMIPAPEMIYYMYVVSFSIFMVLPYVVDRWLTKRKNGFLTTLAFPIVSVIAEYIVAISSDHAGSWCSLAHTQDNLALMQITSITGTWGLTFVIAWFGSATNYFWDKRQEIASIKKSIILFSTIIFSVFLYGQIRNSYFPSNSKTVRIASIIHNESLADSSNFTQDIKRLPAFRNQTYQIQTKLFDLSIKAANEGAKIIFLHEASLLVLKDDEKELVDRGCKLASDKNVYFGLSLFVLPRDFPNTLGEAKIVWINPEGNIIWEFNKAYPTPSDPILPGEKNIKTFDSPYGRIASAICFDMDFPTFINQAGKKDVDIMLVPANDWKEITPYHANMSKLRTIENGFSMVRCTGRGLSTAVDYNGKVLNQLNYFQTEENTMISDVPIKGVKTIYAKMGDWFVWVCIIGLLFIFGKVFYRRKTIEQ
jgi:apolipoprotein N-acyltransferase